MIVQKTNRCCGRQASAWSHTPLVSFLLANIQQEQLLKITPVGIVSRLEEVTQSVAGVLEPVDEWWIGVLHDVVQCVHLHLARLVHVGDHLAIRGENYF